MKPRRRVEKREYWTCAYPEHRHTKQANAVRCIEQASWTDEKYAKAEAMHKAGATYIEIAKRFGASAPGMGSRMESWRRRRREQLRQAEEAEALARQQVAIEHIVRRGWGHYVFAQPYSGVTTLRLFRPGIGPHGRHDIAAQERKLLGGEPSRYLLAKTWREMRAKITEFRKNVAEIWPPPPPGLDKPANLGNG